MNVDLPDDTAKIVVPSCKLDHVPVALIHGDWERTRPDEWGLARALPNCRVKEPGTVQLLL